MSQMHTYAGTCGGPAMTNPLPPPPELDTAEEVREYWRDVERELDRAEMDRPQEGEEW